MKFRSPTAQPISIGLTTGHMACIPGNEEAPNGVELDKRFHRQAIALGALPEGVEAPEPEESTSPDRAAIIDKAIQGMLDGDEPDDFKQDGTPNLTALSRRAGFKVAREEAESAWARVKQAA